jgi:adenylylsulfate kinase
MNNNRIFWILGPTSSGKTTIGKAYMQYLRAQSLPSIHFDGDEFRTLRGSSLGIAPEDRLKNVSLCVFMANKCLEAGSNVVVSALTAHDTARQFVIKNAKNLVVIYLDCPLEVRKQRDSRGLYHKVETGEIKADSIIGIETPYLVPVNPHLVLRSNELTVEESVAAIHEWVLSN